MKLVAYCRVSTSAQASDGTIAVQHSDISSWAKANGHQIVRWCDDEAVSGTKELAARPGLAQAVTEVADGRAEGVVFTKLDRLARDLVVQEATLEVLRRHGAVLSVHDSMMLDDSAEGPEALYRKAMRQVMGTFADLERAMGRWRMEQGRAHKAAQGGYVGGAPPFGKRAEGHELVDDHDEQAIIVQMMQMRDLGWSLRAIAGMLNRNGLLGKRGGTWTPSAVQRVLDPDARAKHAARTRKGRERSRRMTEQARDRKDRQALLGP